MRFLLAVLALVLTGCESIDKTMMAISDGISSPDPVTGQRQINLISEEQEINQAELFVKQLLDSAENKGVKIDDEISGHEMVLRVFDRLKTVVHRKNMPWEIHTIEDSTFNAFTIGGGKVFVHSGLLIGELSVRDENELAAVLAHEMAHVTARHASERQGKLAIAKLADKGLRKEDGFDESFNTTQEDEADKYAALYMALAGYDPDAAVRVWERMHQARGSYVGDMKFTHPLDEDRARNVAKYAAAVRPYYSAGKLNPEHDRLLENNTLYQRSNPSAVKAGEGGGFLALLETLTTTYEGVTEARIEQMNRESKQRRQQLLAHRSLQFSRVKISRTRGGGQYLTGVVSNLSGKSIVNAKVVLEYSNGRAVVMQKELSLFPMQPNGREGFNIQLQPVQFSSVYIRPVYVQFQGE